MQCVALRQAILHYVKNATDNPKDFAYHAVRIVAQTSSNMPWEDDDFQRNFLLILETVVRVISGRGVEIIRRSLDEMKKDDIIPEAIREAVSMRLTEFSEPTSPGRKGTSKPLRQVERRAPKSTLRGLPSVSGSAETLWNQVCNNLEKFVNKYLDIRHQEHNRNVVAMARQEGSYDEWNAGRLEQLVFLAFGSLAYRTHSDPFRVIEIEQDDLVAFYEMSCFLETRPLNTESRAQQVGIFVFSFKAYADLENTRTTPREQSEKLQNLLAAGAFPYDAEPKRAFVRFGIQYLTHLKAKNECTANKVAEWLSAFQQVMVGEADLVDVSARDLLPEITKFVQEFRHSQEVALAAEFLHPGRIDHPWRSKGVFPFWSSEECEKLQRNIDNLELREVREFLQSTESISLMEEYLRQILADPAYSEFRMPASRYVEWDSFSRDNVPNVDVARRRFQTTPQREQQQKQRFREWYIYALSMESRREAKEKWEEIEPASRSFEVEWNLAVLAAHLEQERKAYDMLYEPGIAQANAPYEHVRFAASLVLAMKKRGGKDIPVDIFRLLPIPAAQAYAYALDCPTDPDEEQRQHSMIVAFAGEPFDSALRNFATPHELGRELNQVLENLRAKLLNNGLKRTWRMWLTGYANQFAFHHVLWQQLHSAWTQEDTQQGRKILERGLSEVRDSGRILSQDRLLRVGFVRLLETYLDQLTDEEVNRKMGFLGYLASGARDLVMRNPKLRNRIYPRDKRPIPKRSVEEDPWREVGRCISKKVKMNELRRACSPAFARLSAEFPLDKKHYVKRWNKAFDDLLELRGIVAGGQLSFSAVEELNRQLVAHPPEECEGPLGPMYQLARWIRGSFEEFVKETNLAPALVLRVVDDNPGVDLKASTPSIVVNLTNPSIQTVRNIQISVVRSDSVGSAKLKNKPISVLLAGTSLTLAVPFENYGKEDTELEHVVLTVLARFEWGCVRNLEVRQELTFKTFDFGAHLEQNGVAQDFLPVGLFAYDRALEGELLEELFVGRDEEIEFVRERFAHDRSIPGAPTYFYGIRRVGKTTLVNRLMKPDVLSPTKYVPLYISLFGGSPLEPLWQSFNRFRDRLELELRRVTANEEPPLGVELPTRLHKDAENHEVQSAFEAVLEYVRSIVLPRRPVILVDEFHTLVGGQSTELLSTIRYHYDRPDGVLFILTGWLDHDILSSRCQSSHLWPLEQQDINFLSRKNVELLMTRQFGRCGVVVPKDTVSYVMELTNGNPNLVQLLSENLLPELNRDRRAVVTFSDYEVTGNKIVKDVAIFQNTWYHPDIVELGGREDQAVKQLVERIPEEGAWLSMDDLPESIDDLVLRSLRKKKVIVYDGERRALRISGLLLDRFLREVKIVERKAVPDVVFVLDWENFDPSKRNRTGGNAPAIFPDRTHVNAIAGMFEKYADSFGLARKFVVAHWEHCDNLTVVENAFRSRGFSIVEPLRVKHREGSIPMVGGDQDVADNAIAWTVYNRLIEEAQSSNDKIKLILIASGDHFFVEHVKNLVENHGKRVRLLACADPTMRHMHHEFRIYAEKREEWATMPGENGEPDFVIDDIIEFMIDNPF